MTQADFKAQQRRLFTWAVGICIATLAFVATLVMFTCR